MEVLFITLEGFHTHGEWAGCKLQAKGRGSGDLEIQLQLMQDLLV